MDIVAALRSKIATLANGDYTAGLNAVLLHIETAFRHLARGQETDDDTAFTDVIYRNNQAFEGSIKEAYRVLAGGDPSGKSPYEIESYLETHNVFRPRILKQFTTYRTEWRNPSTHDYKLDFDEGEAFLATVSVTAFSCLLLDQITERLAFIKTEEETRESEQDLKERLSSETAGTTLLARAVEAVKRFCESQALPATPGPRTEMHVIGALHGFLSFVLPEVTIVPEVRLSKNSRFEVDLALRENDKILAFEIKRKFEPRRYMFEVNRLKNLLISEKLEAGILFYLPETSSELSVLSEPTPVGELRVLLPRAMADDIPL